jgi:hypothetical protein
MNKPRHDLAAQVATLGADSLLPPPAKITTCQICGRRIKAPVGYGNAATNKAVQFKQVPVIAHHGYQRQQGWQSASCFGARWRPYEVACDALPPAISSAEHWKVGLEKALAEMLAEPPLTVTFQKKKFGYPDGDPVELPRPNNYDPYDDGSFSPRTYDAEFKSLRNMRRREIASLAADISHMRKRLADWKAPEGTNA